MGVVQPPAPPPAPPSASLGGGAGGSFVAGDRGASRRSTRAGRRAALRRLVFQIHLWIGLTAGLVIAVVALTGSLYVFAPELQAALNPDLLQLDPTISGPALPAGDVVARVEGETGGRVESVQWPNRERETYMFKLFGDDRWIFADPRTGAILGSDADRASLRFVAWLMEVHTSLTMGDVGYVVTGASALLLALVLVSSGIFLWWPRRRSQVRNAFLVRWRDATPRRRLFDLHNVPGAWTSLVMVLLAVTGAYWSFPDATQRVVDAVTASPHAESWPSGERAPRSTPVAGAPPLSIDSLVRATDALFPGYVRRNMWVTDDPTGTVTMTWIRQARIAAGGEWRPTVILDRYSGRTLFTFDPERAPLGAQVTAVWVPPVHFGEVGGLPTRILAFVGGLAPAALWVTGVMLWWGRRRRVGSRRGADPPLATRARTA